MTTQEFVAFYEYYRAAFCVVTEPPGRVAVFAEALKGFSVETLKAATLRVAKYTDAVYPSNHLSLILSAANEIRDKEASAEARKLWPVWTQAKADKFQELMIARGRKRGPDAIG